MATAVEVKIAQVPHIPFKTLRAFFEKVDPIPPRLDRSVLRYTSGSVQNALMTALRSLGLIDDDGRVIQARMGALANAFRAGDRTAIRDALGERLRATYPGLFGSDFQLANATATQLKQKFEEMGVSGDTVRKATSFFLAACGEAGIEFSPHFRGRPGRRPGVRRGPANGATSKKAGAKPQVRGAPSSGVGSGANISNLPDPLVGVLGLLPIATRSWTKTTRDRFVATFEGLLDLCFEVEGEK